MTFNWPQEGARESLWQSPDTCRAFKNYLFSSITLNVITLENKMSKFHLFSNAPGAFLFNFTFLHDFWSQKPQTNTSHTILAVFIVNTASIVLEFQTSFGQTLCTKRVTQFGIWIYLEIINKPWLTQKLLTWHNVCLPLCTSKLVLHHKCLCSIIVYSYFYGFITLSTAFIFNITACEGMHWADFWKVSSLCMLP